MATAKGRQVVRSGDFALNFVVTLVTSIDETSGILGIVVMSGIESTTCAMASAWNDGLKCPDGEVPLLSIGLLLPRGLVRCTRIPGRFDLLNGMSASFIRCEYDAISSCTFARSRLECRSCVVGPASVLPWSLRECCGTTWLTSSFAFGQGPK